MKLLIAELWAFQHYVSREFSYIMRELVSTYGWHQLEMLPLWQDSRPLQDSIYAHCGTMPEVILFWGSDSLFNSRARDILDLPSHKCFFSDDLHWHHDDTRLTRYVTFALCDTIFATYGYRFHDFYPDVAKLRNIVWVPHAASPDFLLPFNEHATNAIFLSGAIDDHYPLRQQLKELSDRHRYPIVHHQHPGYHCRYNYDKDDKVGRGYAVKINHHRVGFTDALQYHYIVAKYFEIPATGALLLADNAVPEPLRQLGFQEYVHYVPVSRRNLEEQIQYVLDEKHRHEIDRIRRLGQQLVWEQHTTRHRAQHIDAVCRSHCR